MWMRRVFYVTSRWNGYDQTFLQNWIVQNAFCQIVGKIWRSQHIPSGTSFEAKSNLVIQTRFTTGIVHSTVDNSTTNKVNMTIPVDTTLRSNKRLDFCKVLLLILFSHPIHPESDWRSVPLVLQSRLQWPQERNHALTGYAPLLFIIPRAVPPTNATSIQEGELTTHRIHQWHCRIIQYEDEVLTLRESDHILEDD